MEYNEDELGRFAERLDIGDYPYDLDKVRSDFERLSGAGFNTSHDQDFVDFCEQSVLWRIRRLARLVELEAPEFIVKGEYAWLVKTVQRLQAAMLGKDWSLSPEEKKELDLVYELEDLAQEDDEEN